MSNSAMVEARQPPPPRPRRRPARATPAPAGRPYGGLSPEDRVAARRARLVEAGCTLFGDQGFRATTVRGICAEAGLTDRYFYESFASVEALLMAVYAAQMDRLRQRLQAVADATPPRHGDLAALQRQATAGYEAWFDLVADRRFARIVLAEVLGVSPAVDALYEASMREFAALNSAPLDALLPAGALAARSRALIGRALVGSAIQVAVMWVSGGYREPRAAVVHSCVLVATGTWRALCDEAGGAR